MSNWRWNFGVGPLRYSRPIKGPKKPGQKATPIGVIVTLVVTLGLMYLCCWGGVAWMNATNS
ncbi:hypothetical protein GA0070564_10327 [Micromonospora mirobrigensis]|uniref:Uncharacterized protein n=1 Tax=Micromonospora mirobrigensis TaxID=262898 RepID=A0A1C4XE57_9ACTN|nr:hypothetical protein GA0070564_10327 [Micromonospora mirobrigensis]